MIHSLLWVKPGNGRHDSSSIARKEDDVLRVATDGRYLHIADMLKWVDDTRVRSQADIIIVDDTLFTFSLVIAGVLNNGAKFDSIENIGLLSTREAISLSVTSTLNIEHVLVSPDVLVITNKIPLGVR